MPPRPPFSLEEAIYRELDQMREAAERQASAFERAVVRLEERDEARDAELSELKLKVAALQVSAAAPARDWKRDAGLVVAPSTIVAIIGAIAQHFTAPEPPPPPRPPVPHVAPATAPQVTP